MRRKPGLKLEAKVAAKLSFFGYNFFCFDDNHDDDDDDVVVDAQLFNSLVPAGRSSPGLDASRKSPTLEQVIQSAGPSAGAAAATTAPAPGLARRSPPHGRTAPSSAAAAAALGSHKAQHQDAMDARRGEA